MRIGEARNQRLEEHHGGDVAHQVRQRGHYHREDCGMVQVPVIGEAEQAPGQSGALRAAHDDEEPDEENQQAPIHLVVHQSGLTGSRDQHDGRAECCHQRGW